MMERKTARRPVTKPRILFLSLPEYGQANVHLAVIHSLKSILPDASLHLGSLSSFAPRTPPNVTFHPIIGQGINDRFQRRYPEFARNPNLLQSYYSAPGFWGTLAGMVRMMVWSFHPEKPSETVSIIKSVEKVISAINPDLIVLDPGFDHASDATTNLGKDAVILSPNTLKEVTLAAQGAGMLKVPCVNTGYPNPVPWYLLPLNFACYLFMVLWTLLSPEARRFIKVRNEAGYAGGLPIYSPRTFPILCMSVPECDYPCIIPPETIPCGPILLPVKPLETMDQELAMWLRKRPTVTIILGSNFVPDEKYAREMFIAIQALLQKRKDVQVLWKLKLIGDWKLPDTAVLGDRLRLVEWLEADPASILRSASVICAVSHGGSNSYHEALANGTPQVILSPWFDCHDFGVRAEWLGVGVWGNRHTAPRCNSREVTSALLTVVGEAPDSAAAERIRERAKEVGEMVRAYHGGKEGRDVAADWIRNRVLRSLC